MAMPTVAQRDRRFFLGMATVVAVSVFIGFAPTYFLKSIYGTPVISPLVHVHAFVFTLWIVLFLTQTLLVSARRTDLHKRLGWLSGGVAIAMIALGFRVAYLFAKKAPVPGLPALPVDFVGVPLGGLFSFTVLVGLGFLKRRKPDTHKRLMLLGTFAMMGAATDRMLLPIGALAFTGLPLHPFTMVAILAAYVVPCFAYDLLTRGRVHPAFLWGGTFLIVWAFLTHAIIPNTAAWRAFSEWVIS
jgi:hypothetical protein